MSLVRARFGQTGRGDTSRGGQIGLNSPRGFTTSRGFVAFKEKATTNQTRLGGGTQRTEGRMYEAFVPPEGLWVYNKRNFPKFRLRYKHQRGVLPKPKNAHPPYFDATRTAANPHPLSGRPAVRPSGRHGVTGGERGVKLGDAEALSGAVGTRARLEDLCPAPVWPFGFPHGHCGTPKRPIAVRKISIISENKRRDHMMAEFSNKTGRD